MPQTPPLKLIDTAALFTDLDQRRETGVLAKAIAEGSSVVYGASVTNAGMQEARYPDGRIENGRFSNGRFVAE